MTAWFRRVLLPAAFAAASPAGASEPPTDYVVLRAGMYLPQADPSPYGGSYGAGPDVELAVGRAFFPWMAGEIGVATPGRPATSTSATTRAASPSKRRASRWCQ